MYRSIIFALFFSFSLAIFAQDRAAETKSITADVEELSHKKYKGREAGTKQELAAAEFIAKRFKEIGLSPLGDKEKGSYTYLQKFKFPKSKDPHTGQESEEQIEGHNVVAYIDNGASSNVIIGGHYDHLGMGGEGSGSLSDEIDIHNGADDNASGVAVMLNLAERLKNGKFKRNNYIFVAFTGEEKGLYGSSNFLKNPPFYLTTMNYMLNLDMVGRYDTEKGLVINGIGTSPIWKTAIERANKEGIKITTTESGVGPSDQTSFYMKDIPAIHFFTGGHEDYHKPSDDPEKLNYEGMLVVSDLVFNLVEDLNSKLKLAFTRTKDEDHSKSRYKVSLGVIPDYMYDGKGMKIDGLRGDRPAEKAGIKAGDIVVKIGDVDVVDMTSYMVGLSQLEEGKISKVIVQRGGKEIEFDVQF